MSVEEEPIRIEAGSPTMVPEVRLLHYRSRIPQNASRSLHVCEEFEGGDFLILLLYVDDMLIVGRDQAKIRMLKTALNRKFAMKDLGPARQILGMHIIRDRSKKQLWLSQEKYVTKVLQRFNMSEAKPVGSTLPTNCKLSGKAEMMKIPYASAVGSLMYAMVCTQPDIGYAVEVVSRFMSNPGKEHWNAVKWILRYLKGTSNMCLRFGSGKPQLDGTPG